MNSRFDLKIKDKNFTVAVADDDDTRYQGLSDLPSLRKDKGMLFIFPDPIRVRMVMRNMNFNLSMLFLNDNFEIIELVKLTKDPEQEHVPYTAVRYVLELHEDVIADLSLVVGDCVCFSDELLVQCNGVKKFRAGGTFQQVGDIVYKVKVTDMPIEKGKMQVLDENGEVAGNFDRDSRIFSRIHTKELIELSKSNDFIKVAEKMIEIIDIQEKQKNSYVKK